MLTARVVVDEVEEPARAHGLRDVHAAAVDALAGAGDDAALDQRDAGVDQQRVQREIAVIAERLQHRLGNRADADLHGGAVGHQRGHVTADGALDVADDRRRILDQRLVDLDAARRSGSGAATRCRACAASRGLTWAMTSGASRAAGSATLTETPRLR